MKYSYTLLVPALAVAVNAQSAPDFPIEVETNLRVDWPTSRTNLEAGSLVARDNILDAPDVFGPNDTTTSETYLIFLIDEDVNIEGQDGKGTFLHWFQPNLAGASGPLTVQNTSDATNASGEALLSAAYLPPTPPGGDGPHRYTFVLFSQPENFTVPEEFVTSFTDVPDLTNRLNFEIDDFVEAAGLSEPVAANWLRVLNGTAEETSVALTSTAAPTSTASGSANTAEATTTGSSASTATGSSGTSSASSSGASASATGSSSNSAVGMVEVRSGMILGLVLGLAGVGLWL